MEAYTPLFDYVHDHYVAFIVGAVVAAILILALRRYAVPLVLKALELVGCVIAMHVVVGTFVRVLSWFKAATRFRGLKQSIEDMDPGFKTPFFEFWNKDLYEPSWLIYLELGFVAAIIVLILYFRPVVFGTKKKSARVGMRPEKVAKYDREGNRAKPPAPGKDKQKGKSKK